MTIDFWLALEANYQKHKARLEALRTLIPKEGHMQPVDRITDIFSSIAPERATHYSPETGAIYAAFWRMEDNTAREVWVVNPAGRLWHTLNPTLIPGDGMVLLALP